MVSRWLFISTFWIPPPCEVNVMRTLSFSIVSRRSTEAGLTEIALGEIVAAGDPTGEGWAVAGFVELRVAIALVPAGLVFGAKNFGARTNQPMRRAKQAETANFPVRSMK